MKFYKCNLCGQIVDMIKETKVPMICCGDTMSEIIPKTNEDGLSEKHIPVINLKKGKLVVNIGEIPHPMTSEHFIEWVAIVTNKGNQRKCLKPGDAPIVTFMLEKDELVKEIYAYCNIHSLWKLEVSKNWFK